MHAVAEGLCLRWTMPARAAAIAAVDDGGSGGGRRGGGVGCRAMLVGARSVPGGLYLWLHVSMCQHMILHVPVRSGDSGDGSG